MLVLADRGLYARWVWDAIRACGWHPFLRLHLGVKARAQGEESFEWISRGVPTPGTNWQGKVTCFAGKASRVEGTLLLHWEAGYESAWVILTDLEAQDAQISWYGLRAWIETGFNDFKRGFWGWHHCKMAQASSVERLWLAMAVASIWCLSLGCQAQEKREVLWQLHEPGEGLSARHIARRKRTRPAGQPPVRRLRCVLRGRLELLALLFQSQPFPIGILRADAWPETLTPPQKQPQPADLHKKQRQRQKSRRRDQKRRARDRARAQN